MKKIIFVILVLILTVGSCKKTPMAPQPEPIINKVGEMTFSSLPELIDDKLIIRVNTTLGSKYLFQLVDFNGNILLSRAVTSDERIEVVTFDVSKVNPGMYDVILLDTKNGETKNPILIK
jgi:hypothetical protein